MKKTPEEKREERLKEISDLIKKRDEINARLNFLTGIAETSNVKPEANPLPEGFSVTKEVGELFKEHPKLSIKGATSFLQKKFPQYEIERQKVQSSLVYLVERKKIKREPEERGVFSSIENT